MLDKPYLTGSLTANHLHYQNLEIKHLNTTLKTQNNRQYFTVKANSKVLTLKTSGEGRWKNNMWQGKFTHFKLEKDKKTWQILNPTFFQLFNKNYQLKQFCLTHQQYFACLNGNYINSDNYAFNFKTFLNPTVLNPIIPIQSASSLFKAKGYFSQHFLLPTSAQANFHISSGDIALKPKKNFASQYFPAIPNLLHIKKIYGFFMMEENTANYSFSSQFNDKDFVNSQGNFLLKPSQKLTNQTANATLSFNLHNIDFLSPFIPFPGETNGHLRGNIDFSGRLQTPNTTGKITLTGSNTSIIPLGVSLDHTNISATITPPFKVTIQGETTLGKSPLKLDGIISYDKYWKIESHLFGKDLKVSNLPDLELTLSPNLYLNNNHGYLLASGKVTVNKAIIKADKMQTLASANSINDDIVYVHNGVPEKKESRPTPISTDLSLDLGKDTKFYGFGLTSYITGKLSVKNSPSQIMLAKGRLYFKNGIYNAYGKSFSIDNISNISYDNNILTSPSLSITANYQIPASLVLNNSAPKMLGISILGKPQNLKLKLISNPALSQADILSYIILGQPIHDNTNNSSSDELSKAALLFAINGGSDTVLKDIKERLGISDFSVGNISNSTSLNNQLQQSSAQTTAQDNTAIFVGKAITSKFYVSYGVGIFTGQQEVNAQYQLNQKWKIRADRTNLDTGADLIYTITPN